MRSVKRDAKYLGLKEPRPAVLETFRTPSDWMTEDAAPERKCQLHILCDACTAYFRKVQLRRDPAAVLLPAPSQHQLHDSVEDLDLAAEQGCHFCSLLLYNFNRFNILPKANQSETLPGVYLLLTFTEGRGRERVGTESRPLPPFESPTIYASLEPTSEDLDTFLRPGEIPDGYVQFPSARSSEVETQPSKVPHEAQAYFETSSRRHMDLARDWLEECAADHPECNRRDPSFTPTRLLYVGRKDEDTALRLHLTQGEKRLKYCCLSHCWGGVSDIPLLKKDTLSAFCNAIDMTSLPCTFQDAVLITRQLGIRYLWIDSLCIVQDSLDDWAQEAADMGKIYQNGWCTIAATEAKNSHEGCFVHRNPLNCNAVRIASSTDGELFIRPPMGRYFDNSDGQLSPYVALTAKLFSRGWVFQESLLSQKVLHFGKGLFWMCRKGQASELDPLGRGLVAQGMVYGPKTAVIFSRYSKSSSRNKQSDAGTRVLDMFFRNREGGGNAPGRHEYGGIRSLLKHGTTGTLDYQLHKQWMGLLRAYTALKLTMEKDRLVALSGIVQGIKKYTKSKYYAGLWEISLPMDLVWTIYEDWHPRPSGHHTPTWSWASIEGRIGTNFVNMFEEARQQMEILIKVVSVMVECHPADATCTGEVFDAELVLEGMLFQYKAIQSSWPSEHDWALFDDEGNEVGELVADTDPAEIPERVFVLPVIRAAEHSYSWKAAQLSIHGLGLFERNGYFERVGYYSFESSPDKTIDFSSTHTTTIKIR